MIDEDLNICGLYLYGMIKASCPPEKTCPKINEDCDKNAPVPEWETGYPKEMERIYALEYEWEAELQRRERNALPQRT